MSQENNPVLQDIVSKLEQTVACLSGVVSWLQSQEQRICACQSHQYRQGSSISTLLGELTTQQSSDQFLAAKMDDTSPQESFRHFSKNYACLEAYFSGIRSKLLIMVDESAHQIRLSFGDRPSGKNFDPIKALLSHEVCTKLSPFSKTEYTIGFARVCDLKAIAWAVAMEYRELGYSCTVRSGAEAIDVDQILAEAEPSPIWRQLQEVPSCA